MSSDEGGAMTDDVVRFGTKVSNDPEPEPKKEPKAKAKAKEE